MITPLERLSEIKKSRTKFQLERFVLGQHPKDERRYFQLLLEIESLYYSLKRQEISIQKLQLEISDLDDDETPMNRLLAAEKSLDLQQAQSNLQGIIKDYEDLIHLYDNLSHHYSLQEIEAAEEEYWIAKLSNNARAMLVGGNPINPGYLESLEQAGGLENFIAEVNESQRQALE